MKLSNDEYEVPRSCKIKSNFIQELITKNRVKISLNDAEKFQKNLHASDI